LKKRENYPTDRFDSLPIIQPKDRCGKTELIDSVDRETTQNGRLDWENPSFYANNLIINVIFALKIRFRSTYFIGFMRVV
jgi:hypothetical protein